MEAIGAERAKPRLSPNEAARKRAAAETYARHEAVLRQTAHRYSLCADDADDALQRGLEILLRKAPTAEPRELVKWMQTVVKHEALAVRRERERVLSGPAAVTPTPGAEDWVALLPSRSDGPAERLERREAIARSREALQALKPQELRALTLLAEGYSYAEIGEITDWSPTKINRCLAEGRERFRSLLARSEDGSRCAEMRPLLSAFCDGEAGPKEVAELREHLRACATCRATMRTYRAAPAAAVALAPAPLHHSLWERIREALAEVPSRFGGGRGEAISQIAGGGSAGGAGLVGLMKVAAVYIGAAGAACVATGIVPAPLQLDGDPHRPAERRVEQPADVPQAENPPAAEPAPVPNPQPERSEHPSEPAPVTDPPAASEPVAPEPEPVAAAPIESAPAPEAVAEPTPPSSSGGSSPAGEFGP